MLHNFVSRGDTFFSQQTWRGIKQRVLYAGAILASLTAGAFIGIQTRIQAGLSIALGNPFFAGSVSFVSGMQILLFVVALVPSARRGLRTVTRGVIRRTIPWWVLSGGVCGAVLAITQASFSPLLGVATFTTGVVAGQTVGGLLTDKAGVGPAGKLLLTWPRVAGSVLFIVSAVIAVAPSFSVGGRSGPVLFAVIAPFIAGVGVAWQSAVNGRLYVLSKSVIAASVIHFGVGLVLILTITGFSVIFVGLPGSWPTQPWYYLGGAIATVFIAIGAIFVKRLGVLVLSMTIVAGQISGSLLVELWFPLTTGASLGNIVGVVVSASAIVIIMLNPTVKVSSHNSGDRSGANDR